MSIKTDNKNYILVALFLIGISFAMFLLGLTYCFTSNLNVSWICFGVIYAVSLFGILGNKKLKRKLEIESDTRFIQPTSIIILAIGLILSFSIGANLGDRYLIFGVLFTVGLHFLPFGARSSYILSILVCINSILILFILSLPIWGFILIDGLIKFMIGIQIYFQIRYSKN